MLDDVEFCRELGLQPTVLAIWIEEGWVRPESSAEGKRFSAVDIARGRLILDLRGPMGVNEEGVAVILHLLDQMHGLRNALRGLAATRTISKQSM
ncbi:MAG: MerR family transcriptional regulator [Hyphomicrobiales bacterium]|nr:MerR family transcriptional regulator [Hyphomicrobiales bacterium]